MNSEIAVAIITGSFATLGIVVTYLLDVKKKNRKLQEELTPKLVNHAVFSRLDMLKNHIKMSFSISNKGKEKVFKDLLTNNIDIWGEVLKEMATELDSMDKEIDNVALWNLVSKFVEEGISRFNNYYKNDNYTTDEQRVLGIIMEKFNKWNFPRVNSFLDEFRTICNSQFYSNSKVKSAFIMDLTIMMFIDIVNDAESTLNELNGDLKGLVFKGVTI